MSFWPPSLPFNPDPTRMKATFKEYGTSDQILKFPGDLTGAANSKAIKFSFYEYQKLKPGETEKAISADASIALQLPPQLAQGHQFSWNDFDGGLEYTAYKALTTNQSPGYTPTMDEVGQKALALAGSMGSALAGQLTSNAANISDVETGRALNPRQLARFDRVGFRTYSFSFLMIAKNEAESKSIQKIVKTFKRHAHPSLTAEAAFFEFPSLVLFRYLPSELEEFLWKPQPCAITGISVDYNASGPPKFHKNGAPVEALMNVQLREILINTRKDIEDGY